MITRVIVRKKKRLRVSLLDEVVTELIYIACLDRSQPTCHAMVKEI
jgi:hypothetical protein